MRERRDQKFEVPETSNLELSPVFLVPPVSLFTLVPLLGYAVVRFKNRE
jgi:hypothetical protein